jgi:hypothetical protein
MQEIARHAQTVVHRDTGGVMARPRTIDRPDTSQQGGFDGLTLAKHCRSTVALA